MRQSQFTGIQTDLCQKFVTSKRRAVRFGLEWIRLAGYFRGEI
jgi:hypothetical protein